MPQKMLISTREVRTALAELLDQLDQANLTGLEKRVKHGKTAQTPDEWVTTLRTAMEEIPEWCPSGGFMIDVPAKE